MFHFALLCFFNAFEINLQRYFECFSFEDWLLKKGMKAEYSRENQKVGKLR